MPSREVVPKFYRGALHSGSKKGPLVTKLSQAKAIAASEARAEKAGKGHGKKQGRSAIRRAMGAY